MRTALRNGAVGFLVKDATGEEMIAAVRAAHAGIARRLRLSEATVKAHISRILTELDLTNRVRAGILAHRAGLDRRPAGAPRWRAAPPT